MSDGSSSSTEEVQVDTDDLAHFVERGTTYLTSLTGIFDSVRTERKDAIAYLQEHPDIAEYTLYGTGPDGSKALVAEVRDGERKVADQELFDSMKADAAAEAERLRKTVITQEFIDEFTADLPEGYAADVRASVAPYIGFTWYDALEHHSAKPPEVD